MSNEQTGAVLVFVLVLLIALGIFLLLRALMCWYWKIGRRIELMEEHNEHNALLERQLKVLEAIRDKNSGVEPHRDGE